MSAPRFEEVAQLSTSAEGVVLPEHIDANGHMNIRHYVEYDSLGTFAVVEDVGIDDAYRAERGMGLFTAEHHLRYHRELREGARFSVHVRFLARGERSLHLMAFLLDQDQGLLANTLEVLAVHVDLTTRRSTPIPEDIAAGFDRLVVESDALAWTAPTCGAMGVRGSRPRLTEVAPVS
jgi:acyl-CoA thioester hydrolase